MSLIRRALLAFALLASAAPALAQVPPPVPALPDTERRTAYQLTASTCVCTVNMALYGDSTDYQSWVEVYLNGVLVNFNDPTFGWTITSPTGPLASIPRPITDGILTFTSAQTGTVQIVGARRPRRVSQFSENRGVAARDLNQVITDIVAQNRETWDKINDVTGRSLISQPGNVLGMLPLPSVCSSAFLAFDATGLNPVCVSGVGGGSVTLPVVSGNLICANGTTGILKDCGVAPYSALPLPVAQGGTGTATPGLIAGSNVTVTGTWPNQTVASTGGGGGGSSAACVQDFVAGTGFTAGTTTALTTTCTPGNAASVAVFFDGVKQSANTWSLSSQTFTFSAAIPSFTQVVEVQAAIPGTSPSISSTLAVTGKSLWYNNSTNTYSYGWMSPNGPTLDLRDCMDAQYGVGSWSATTDIEPALHACFLTIQAHGGRGTISVPTGIFALNTVIPPGDLSGNYIIGQGSQASQITVGMSSGAAFFWSGTNNTSGGFTGGGMKGIALRLCCNLGVTSTIAILGRGNASFQPDQMEFEDLYITGDCNAGSGGGSWWNSDFQMDGTARTAPQGMRVQHVANIQLFCASAFAFFLSNAVQFDLSNVGTYVGNPGTGTGTDCYITGNGSAPTNSIQVSIVNLACGGTFHLTNASYVYPTVKTNALSWNSTATFIIGLISAGSVTGAAGAHSNVLNP